ncbi:MAG: hypothetical protein ACRDL5_01665, partial [Solirubrobacteraceae bacterium]
MNLTRLDARERPHREASTSPSSRLPLWPPPAAPIPPHASSANGPVPVTADREALIRAVRNLLD